MDNNKKEIGKKWLQRRPKIKAKSNQIREIILGKQGLNEKGEGVNSRCKKVLENTNLLLNKRLELFFLDLISKNFLLTNNAADLGLPWCWQ